jgi:Tfp pilus assembly protein PilX
VSPRPATRNDVTRAWRREDGVVLAVALLLLLVLTLLGTTGLVTAVLEVRMAANVRQQERAFAAAEFGIEQALHATGLTTSLTLSNPRVVPASGSAPAVPGSSPDTYAYRLYYDTATTPARPEDAEAGLKAYHFVIEATGTSARGAADTHVQGFYVLGPDPAPATFTPSACTPDCSDPAAHELWRTFWLQKNAE